MIICPSEVSLEPASVYRLVQKHGINILDGTPAVIFPLMQYLEDHKLDTGMLNWVMVGADRCPAPDF